MLKNLAKYKTLLGELVKRDIKVKYKGSVLGIIWSVLNPLLMMLIMSVVFTLIFRFQIEHYIVYLLTGQVLFSFMTEATTQSMNSIVGNGALLRKIYIPKYIFPVSKVLSVLVNLGFNMIAVFVIMAIDGAPFSWSLFMIPVVMIFLMIFTVGLGLFLSSVVVFFRDIQHIYGLFTVAWMYITPIFYPMTLIPEKYQIYFKLNPMYHFVTYFRMIVLDRTVPSLEYHGICLGIAVVMFLIGFFVFRSQQYKFLNYV
jgi:ABC-2 type transport system permease protein